MVDDIKDIDGLKEFIAKRTRETWDDRHIPYYLSYVASDLKSNGVNYRDYIGPAKLSQWASVTDFPDIKFITHPIVKAKVGFVPSDSNFSFEAGTGEVPEETATKESKRKGHALFQFVDSLAKLPDEALKDLTIPASVLTALLRTR
ncbi:hypothetical protein [Rhizobium leguminosarum]|uniref:hypothetical protein n=1 Tax=Rhizobium leguminosarum TaxID=384 RepID=UPI003F977A30